MNRRQVTGGSLGMDLPGHVKMQGTDDIDAGLGLIQPELSPEPGVEIDQLEASAHRVESPVEIDDSL